MEHGSSKRLMPCISYALISLLKYKHEILGIIIWFGSLLYAVNFSPIKLEEIRKSFEPNYGYSALPPEVVEMKILAMSNKLDNFKLSQEFLSSDLTYQRSIEYLYPVLLDLQSRFLFSPASFKSNECSEIARIKLVVLHVCK